MRTKARSDEKESSRYSKIARNGTGKVDEICLMGTSDSYYSNFRIQDIVYKCACPMFPRTKYSR